MYTVSKIPTILKILPVAKTILGLTTTYRVKALSQYLTMRALQATAQKRLIMALIPALLASLMGVIRRTQALMTRIPLSTRFCWHFESIVAV